MRYSLMVAAALVGCSLFTEPVCGCSPPPPTITVINGVVTDPASVPVVGARIVLEAPCAIVLGRPVVTTHTQAGGTFRHVAVWPTGTTGEQCHRLWAEPPAGSALMPSDTQLVRIVALSASYPDSVQVRLFLRLVPAPDHAQFNPSDER